MAVTSDVRAPGTRGGLRPLQPVRDLRAVVKLVGDAFADQMDERALAALREMRWLARLTPLLWWLERADPSFADWFGGFVWEEEGRIVGNVSLQRAPGQRRGWMICNVVVEAAYRRRGIGRQLVETALEEAQVRGAEAILLQVHTDNVGARTLYERLGFQAVGVEAEWHLPVVQPVPWRSAPAVRLGRWDAKTGRLARDLARQALPAAQQWLRPVRHNDYEYGWLQRVADGVARLLMGRRTLRLAAWRDGPDGEPQLRAIMLLQLNLRSGQHQAELMIHPDESEPDMEEMLVGHLLQVLSDLPPSGLAVRYQAWRRGLREVLTGCGFREQRTLLTMQYMPSAQ
jgi:ribosomal protein S18 acetylase RimI-like enzyme